MNRLVSIIMPAYNAASFLRESIESVQAQTYTKWELIIVDDESSDGTADLVKEYASNDLRVRYQWQKNGKQGKSRNTGLALAKGEYIAFMDADDLWMPKKLSYQVQLIQEHEVDLIFGQAYYIKEDLKTKELTGQGYGFYQGTDAITLNLLSNSFVISSVLTKSSVVRAVGCFAEDLRFQYCEDWHFWLKIALSGYRMYSDTSVYTYYRVHPLSASQVEITHNVKYFYAFLDLSKNFDNPLIKLETDKRAIGLIYHEQKLPFRVVFEAVLWLTKNRAMASIWSTFSRLYYPLFRKLFILFLSFKKQPL